MDIQETLKERGSRYGSFIEQGRIEQRVKRAFRETPNWDKLDDDMTSALEMIATKISRILKGDPWYDDSWRDISGYSALVANRLEEQSGNSGQLDCEPESPMTFNEWCENHGMKYDASVNGWRPEKCPSMRATEYKEMEDLYRQYRESFYSARARDYDPEDVDPKDVEFGE